MTDRRGRRTLLASVLLSAPGPLALGLGLLAGQSATQIADFVRRSVEFAATVVSWLVYRACAPLPAQDARRLRLERRARTGVAAAMIIAGVAMGALAAMGYAGRARSGSPVPALVIAILSVISNGIVAINYGIAWKRTPGDVLRAQRTMYRTKAAVDLSVCATLTAVLALRGPPQRAADLAGGAVVTAVLLVNGLRALKKPAAK